MAVELSTIASHLLTARQLSGSSQPGSHRTKGSSVSALVSTFVPALILAAVLLTAFILLRQRLRHIYQPRVHLDLLEKDERTIPEHPSLLGFIKDLASTHDDYILGHQSIDAYLYVRFLKMIVVLCFVGCCITWPVLFPVNATGGGGQGGLDILSFSNVNSSGRYFVHTFVAWTYLGFVMFAITRETLHYISLRQAYLLSSWNASRISARTVLFTSIPDEYLDAQRLRHLFPAFKQIWIAMDPGDLNDKVEDRDEAALMLEKAEISMSEAANDKRLQVYNDNDKASEKDDEAPLSRPSNRRVDNDVRPTHRLKKKMVVEYGKKVDTIDWARDELAKSVPEIEELQDSHISNGSKRLPAAFVEFEDQQAAAVAFALSNHNEPAHIIGRQLGVLPDEVIWKNLHLKYWQTTIRYIIATAAVCALILFWSVPVAFVGILSNVDYLTGNVDFLRWLNSVPPVVLGVITGLLPTLLLALLMLLVPRLLRKLAVKAGAVTKSEAEMQTQTWYFFFQLIQVFLITTFSSGATSVASQIVSQPSSAVILLAKNLPKASNFYIAYFVLQGLLMSCRNLIRPIPLIKEVRRHFKAKSPRKRFNRYMKLSDVKWGSKYPKFANLGVIAISYSCIAPLMLGFATVGMALIYIAARYNAIYVYDTKIDTKGAAYARALQHLTVGVYISELCLIGLFAIRAGDSLISIAPLALMVMFLVATGLWHLTMRKAVEPLTRHLPRNLLLETAEAYDDIEAASLLTHGNHPAQSTDNLHSIHIVNGSSLSHCRSNVNSQRTSDGTSNGIHHAPSNLNNIFEYSPHYNPSDASTRRGSRMFAFFQPQKDTAVNISARLDPSFHEPVPHYSQELAREAYLHPAVKAKPPKLWIVRDEMGISQREINEIREKIPRLDISDDGAHFDEKGKIVVDVETWRDAPLWEPKMRIKY